jgi:hypothetical protein
MLVITPAAMLGFPTYAGRVVCQTSQATDVAVHLVGRKLQLAIRQETASLAGGEA